MPELRKFILKLGLFLMIWGAVLLRGQWTHYAYWAAAWSCVLGLGLLYPRPFAPLRTALRRLGRWIGRGITFLLLAGVFFLVLFPLGFFARRMGKRFLASGRAPEGESYWIQRGPAQSGRAGWERQY